HTRFSRDWSSDVCSSDLLANPGGVLDLSLLGNITVQTTEDVITDYREVTGSVGGNVITDDTAPDGTVVSAVNATDVTTDGTTIRSEERRVGEERRNGRMR